MGDQMTDSVTTHIKMNLSGKSCYSNIILISYTYSGWIVESEIWKKHNYLKKGACVCVQSQSAHLSAVTHTQINKMFV